MLNISFVGEEKNTFDQAVQEYQSIWREGGERIIQEIEKVSGLAFKTAASVAAVYEGRSQSHPLRLRASLSIDEKQATLVHELCHVLIADNRNPLEKFDSLENHKELNLILYDIWSELWGADFADQAVKKERIYNALYSTAWDWALGFSKEERSTLFQKKLWN